EIRLFTISAARSIAFASSSEVPPNFITSIWQKSSIAYSQCQVVQPFGELRSTEISLGFQQFGIEQRGAGSSADGIVRENSKLPIQDATGAKSSNRGRHPKTCVGIEPGLGTIQCRRINHWLLWSGR